MAIFGHLRSIRVQNFALFCENVDKCAPYASNLGPSRLPKTDPWNRRVWSAAVQNSETARNQGSAHVTRLVRRLRSVFDQKINCENASCSCFWCENSSTISRLNPKRRRLFDFKLPPVVAVEYGQSPFSTSPNPTTMKISIFHFFSKIARSTLWWGLGKSGLCPYSTATTGVKSRRLSTPFCKNRNKAVRRPTSPPVFKVSRFSSFPAVFDVSRV